MVADLGGRTDDFVRLPRIWRAIRVIAVTLLERETLGRATTRRTIRNSLYSPTPGVGAVDIAQVR